MSVLPIILLGGAILLLGGKKKKKSAGKRDDSGDNGDNGSTGNSGDRSNGNGGVDPLSFNIKSVIGTGTSALTNATPIRAEVLSMNVDQGSDPIPHTHASKINFNLGDVEAEKQLGLLSWGPNSPEEEAATGFKFHFHWLFLTQDQVDELWATGSTETTRSYGFNVDTSQGMQDEFFHSHRVRVTAE